MTNVFLVHTEYHLMVTIRMIVSCFNKDSNIVYYTVRRIKNHPSLPTNDYAIVFIPLPAKDYGVKSVFLDMMATKPSNFIVFQDFLSDNIYLIYNFYRKRIKVSLVQDGFKPYPIWHRKHQFVVIIKETTELYLQMAKRRSLIPSFFLRSYKYGKLRYFKELWLDYPDKLPYKSKKKINKIPDFTEESKTLCFSLFSYCKEKTIENAILFIGQPLKTEELRRREVDTIEKLLSIHSTKTFIYRPHPNMSKEQQDRIIQISGVNIYDKPMPIELLMLSMDNSIIVSPWSTALLTNNKKCRFYWIYKLIFDNFAQAAQYEIVNPTDHIIEVNSIEEVI